MRRVKEIYLYIFATLAIFSSALFLFAPKNSSCAQVCTGTSSCLTWPSISPGKIPMGSDYQCVLTDSPFLVNTSTKQVSLGNATDKWLLKIFGLTGIESTGDDYGVKGIGNVGAGGFAVGVYGLGKKGVIGESSVSGELGVYGVNLSGVGVLGYGDTGLRGVGRTYGLEVYPETTGSPIKNYIMGSLSVNTTTFPGVFNVATGTINAFTVSNTGNVGIGTTAPDSRLSVRGTATAPIQTWQKSDGTTVAIIDANGNVGIGTTTPAYKLDVAGALRLQPSSAPTGAKGVIYYDSTADKFKCFEGAAWKDCISAGAIGGSGTTNYIAKWTGSTTLGNSIIYDDGTNVGIGTTNPNNRLQVVDLINFNNTDFNTLLGYQAGKNIVAGAQFNTFIGYQAGFSSSTATSTLADYNTAIGYRTLFKNASGAANTALGYSALYSNTTGNQNTAIGHQALYYNTTGHGNVAIGYNSLYSNTAGYYNTAIGYNALFYNTSGYDNIAIGYAALNSNTTGYNNVAIGRSSLYSNNNGNNNIAIGYWSLGSNTSGRYNTALGIQALYSNSSGTENTAVGYFALGSNTTGSYNTALGVYALYFNSSGTHNSALGELSLYSNTTGSYNTALGYWALGQNATGTNNVAIGYEAGLRTSDGNYNTNSTGSIYIGAGTKAKYSRTTNEIVIGYNAVGEGSNSVVLGNDNITKTILKGNVGIGTTAPTFRLHVNAGNGDNWIASFQSGTDTSGRRQELLLGYNSVGDYAFVQSVHQGVAYTNLVLQRFGGAVIVGDGTGKINVGTIDPIYTINNVKYATYLPGMTGVKEETTGVIQIQNAKCKDQNENSKSKICEYEIDFSKEKRGSDLWLFWQITDFGKDWENLTVLLTPNFNGRTWYEKKPNEKKLLIYAQIRDSDNPMLNPEISYRLTAPRFDYEQHPNKLEDDKSDINGFILNEKE